MARKRRDLAPKQTEARQDAGFGEKSKKALKADKRQASAGEPFLGRYLWWFVISLVALIVLPNMYAGTFVPKMFWALATIGLAWIFLPPKRLNELAPTPLALIWLGYLVWALISLAWAIQPRIGFERWAIIAVWTCGYMVALRTRFWESARFWVLFQYLFIVVCSIGVLQFLFSDLPFLAWIPGSGLPYSTMGHRNYACMYLSITLPFMGWLFLRPQENQSRILPGIALLLGISFLIFTRAREAWIAAVVSFVFMMVCGGWTRLRTSRWMDKRLVAVAILIILPLLFIGPATNVFQHGWRAMPEEKKSIFTAIMDPFKRKHDPRLEMWIPALKMMNPATGSLVVFHGYGFGNFPIASTPTVESVRTLDYEIHNDYLQALVDLGLPGMLLFTGFFFCLMWLAWKGRRQGVNIAAGGAVVGLAVVQMFTFTSENISPIVWMVGVAAILNGQGLSRPVFRVSIPAPVISIGHWGIALFLCAFCVVVGMAISAERRIYRETEITRQPDLEQLATQVLPRMRFNSNIAFIKAHELAAISMELKMPDAAEAFARRALYLHPYDWGSMEILASVAAASGRLNDAITYLERAAVASDSSPSPGLWEKLSQFYAMAGKKELAAKAGQAAAAKLVKKPMNISPANGAKDISGPPVFSWKEAANAYHYDIYLWREGDPFPNLPQVYHVKKPQAKVDLHLQPGAKYYWFVLALGPTGKVEGERWEFTAKR